MKSAASSMIGVEDESDPLQIDDLYLIFRLGKEEYGISIGHVTEIVGRQNITRVPNSPGYVQGVINLRGQVIPVIDVRTRFGMEFRPYDDRSCSIVISVKNALFGLMVDVVEEVTCIGPERISAPPLTQNNPFIRGIGLGVESKDVKLLLAVEQLFQDCSEEVAQIPQL